MESPDTITSPNSQHLAAAREAVACALPFPEFLANRFVQLADKLRRGDDAPALLGIGESTEELHHFLEYLILVGEVAHDHDPTLGSQVAAYRSGLTNTIQALEPALGGLDLVEVADTLELDVVRSIEAYAEIHEPLREALAAA